MALLPTLDIGHNISLPRPWLGLDIEKIDDVANSYPGTGESFEVKSCLVLTPASHHRSQPLSIELPRRLSPASEKLKRHSQFRAPLGQL